ncbi:MAG: hypothetical protein KF869_07635 [Phycisphaeraceae bacterium]|nr:hypothetical protein [Phycisphaeraceae bacterium]
MRSPDDRGRLVKVIPAYQLGGAGVFWCPLPRETRILVQGQLQRGPWTEYYLPFVALLVLWLIIFSSSSGAMIWFIRSTRSLPWFLSILPGLLIPVSMFPFMYWAMWRMRARVARLIVLDGCCATCGYALDGVEPASDGCTVCPECGSAWNLSIMPANSDSRTKRSEFASVFCRDDRALRIPLARQWRAGTLPGISSAVPRRFRGIIPLQRPDRETAKRAARSMGVMLLGLLAWFVLWARVGAPLLTGLHLSALATSILRVLIPAAPLPLFIALLIALSRQGTARILAAATYCPSCGNALANVPAAPDGCTVCPECGSAWRITSKGQSPPT